MFNFFRRGNEEPQGQPNPDWRTYKAGECDREGNRIEKICAKADDYILYFAASSLYYQVGPTITKSLGPMDSCLAKINRLLPRDPGPKLSWGYKNMMATLELAADGCEMVFCGEEQEGLEILNGLVDRLKTYEESRRRLWYQIGTLATGFVFWVLYCVLWYWKCVPREIFPWMFAAVLAVVGGVFSVCLNISSLEVNVNQTQAFVFIAGATRAIVAMLAGIAVLLAMRSKSFAGVIYKDGPPRLFEYLTACEMFFCFLAGFSESFVPNILKDNEGKTGSGKGGAPGSDKGGTPRPGGDPDKAAREKAAAEKAAADKAAAEKAAATGASGG